MFGLYKEYYSNGTLHIECHYTDHGKLHGRYREFDAAGNLLKDCTYIDGVEQIKQIKNKGVAICATPLF